MNPINASTEEKEPASPGMPVAGVLFGFSAAVLYTLANLFLRRLSTEVDPFLVAAMKATFTAMVGWTALAITARRNRGSGAPVFPPRSGLIALLLAAIQVQLFGGVLVQIAFGTLGMALVVPIYIGSLVASTAILGAFFLREPVSVILSIALTVIIGSVFLLSMGAGDAHEKMQTGDDNVVSGLSITVGLVAAFTVGIAYAVLGVTIRGTLKKFKMSQFAPVAIVASTGMVLLGTLAISRGAISALQTMELSWIAMMILAGLSNAFAFLCLVRALKLLPVVYVNAINASQVALSAIVGLTFFAEPLTWTLAAGLAVMMFGFVLLGKK
ncbi:MAG: DMT family transporter [Planctomycetota bacterium]